MEITSKFHVHHFNPLKPNGNCNYRIIKISFLKNKGSWEKFYERRVYVSVDDETLSNAPSQNLAG